MTGNPHTSAGSLLTEKEVAQRWRVSPGRLRNERVAGKGLAYIKLGRSVRYRLSDIETYERAHCVSSTSEVR